MEIEWQGLGLDFHETEEFKEALEGADLGTRAKTSLRIHYEAQVSVIQKQAGSLEEIRNSLGLSQRKMSQLLLVDPSTWTRWTKQGDEAPPHIWRALQWYMALREKIPGLTPQYFLGTNPQVLHKKALQELEQERVERIEMAKELSIKIQNLMLERSSFSTQINGFKKDLKFHQKISIIILLTSLCGWAMALWFWKGL